LEALKQSPIVNITVHITSTTDPIVTSETVDEDTRHEENIRRSIYVEPQDSSAASSVSVAKKDLEASLGKELSISGSLEAKIDEMPRVRVNTKKGRPDITALVGMMVKDAQQKDIVAVGACGPAELMRVARNAVADNITLMGPSITLHCEQFGWG
jgi:hypothetical protein